MPLVEEKETEVLKDNNDEEEYSMTEFEEEKVEEVAVKQKLTKEEAVAKLEKWWARSKQFKESK